MPCDVIVTSYCVYLLCLPVIIFRINRLIWAQYQRMIAVWSWAYELRRTVALTVFVLLGNVVTQWRCGGRKNFSFTRHKFLLLTVKKWLKSVLNYQSYPKNKTGYPFFLDHPVVYKPSVRHAWVMCSRYHCAHMSRCYFRIMMRRYTSLHESHKKWSVMLQNDFVSCGPII